MDPKTRGDCLPGGINEARPCKWSTCVYHQKTSSGALCVLDLADAGEIGLGEIAFILGLSAERVRQIEWKAMRKLRRRLKLIHNVSVA